MLGSRSATERQVEAFLPPFMGHVVRYTPLSKQQLGSLLWGVADTALRGKVEDYKAYILSLPLFKRLFDNYKCEMRSARSISASSMQAAGRVCVWRSTGGWPGLAPETTLQGAPLKLAWAGFSRTRAVGMIPSFSRRRGVHWDSISTTPSVPVK